MGLVTRCVFYSSHTQKEPRLLGAFSFITRYTVRKRILAFFLQLTTYRWGIQVLVNCNQERLHFINLLEDSEECSYQTNYQ